MNRLALKLRFCAAFLLLGLWGADAQTAREQIAAVPERAGGIYHSYEYRPAAAAPAPDGYTPFYISHYGRHGSRWHASESVYAGPLKILRKAAEAGALTPLGRDVLGRVEIIAADADKRYGDLSPRGVAEHRGIAERMYKAYPEVFSTADGRECRIESRSTLVPRCILSMAAFNERLKELNPAIRTTRESSARYMPYMGNNKGLDAQRDRTLKTADSVRAARLIPDRLMKSLFSDPEFVKREVKKPRKLMEQLLLQAAIMQDVDYLGISLYDLFTGEEIYAAWEDENFRRYVMFGPSKRFGDPIIAAGTVDDIIAAPRSITGQYLSGAKKIPLPEKRREGNGKSLKIFGAAENNLRHIDVEFPLGTFTCVTGVSGSGKSSLVNEILYKKLAGSLNRARTRPGKFDRIEGLEHLDKVVGIDQSPIGRMPSSNPATYTGVFNDIRDLFASTADARTRGYGPGRFSFNTKGGRCEACSGNGLVKIEMHFLADVFVPCEVCRGKRYNRETLEVLYKGKNIADILDMTAEEALAFFDNLPRIRNKIATLVDVGLGYIKLGQSATTLSGGEAQRVKLATELSRRATGRTFYILDEPTTGLHMADVHKLIEVLQRLVDAGNTVLVIEHNLDVIKVADYIVDLGPEGGSGGGQIVACGTPEQIAACPESFTGQYLKKLLK